MRYIKREDLDISNIPDDRIKELNDSISKGDEKVGKVHPMAGKRKMRLDNSLKVNYVNDLHLGFYAEFHNNQIKYEKRVRDVANEIVENTECLGELLIISGDFGEMNNASVWFLDEISKRYNKVVFTYGNHDLYLLTKNQKRKYKNSINRVKDLYNSVKELNNDKLHFVGEDFDGVLEYRGYRIGGDIMLSSPKTEEEKSFYNFRMNDAKCIFIEGYGWENTVSLNKKNLDYYNKLKEENLDVFISHYPIIRTDSHNRHGLESLGSYFTAVPEFIAKYNFFGHVHEIKEYDTYDNLFLTHAVGYPHELGKTREDVLNLGFIKITK